MTENKIQLFQKQKVRTHWDEEGGELSENIGQLKI